MEVVATVTVAYALTLVWLFSIVRLNAVRQIHHFYYGIPLVVAGIASGHLWLAYVGLVPMLDDAVQHFVQLWRPEFRSPLHLLARYVVFQPLERLRNRHSGR